MFAKQTFLSASLWLVLACQLAVADDAAPDEHPHDTAEAHPHTGTFQVGAGFSTDDNFIATARIEQPNLFGTGRLLALDAMISARYQRFALDYAEPHLLGSDATLAVTAYSDTRQLPGFTRRANGSLITLLHRLGEHITASIGYRIEDVAADRDAHIAARGTSLVPDHKTISALRWSLVYSTVDSPIDPMHGTAIGTALEVADPRLGSEMSYVRTRAWANTHHSLGALTLHLSGSAETIDGPTGIARSERLYFDGSRDVRGYAPGAIGPLGGGNLAVFGRAELELPVIRSAGLSLSGFYDAGMIVDEFGRGGVGRSTGFGLSWHSPLGVMKFAWAIPLDGGKPHFVFSL
jgi:outer membrane protein insertion porin family